VYAGTAIYAATDGGLSISSDGGAFTNYTTNNGLGSNTVNGVYEVYTNVDNVYAATSGGLSISNVFGGAGTYINYTLADGLGANTVTAVYAIGSTVYAATYGGGLSISTTTDPVSGRLVFTPYTTANSGLGSDIVLGVYAVGDGLAQTYVYAATAGGGLGVSNDNGQTYINKTTADGLGSPFVFGVYAVGNTVYAATSGGLSFSNNNGRSFTNTVLPYGIPPTGVYVLGNTSYVATNNGLFIDTGAGTSLYRVPSGLGSNDVTSVFAFTDLFGTTVYAATSSGLSIAKAT
jgi:hypothetical protein